MAKRKHHPHHRSSKKFTVMDLLKGNFLNKEEVKQYYKYILFCFTLLMIMIFTNDLVNRKIGEVNALKSQVEEYKSQNAYTQSKFIKIKLESELSKEVLRDSLQALESHPLKILVKMDSLDYDRIK